MSRSFVAAVDSLAGKAYIFRVYTHLQSYNHSGMTKPINILFISSEVDPFAKTGGLADVSGALPQTVKQLDHEIRVMMPRYGSINERKSKLHEMLRLKEIDIPVGSKSYSASVKSSFITDNHSKVQVYFLDNPHLFGRSGLYVHPETKKDYADNDERFIFFNRGVLEVLKRLGWAPDIIHCNDWPTGLVPAYLKTLYKADPFYKETRTVFTIHNMAYQGVFPKSSFAKTLLPPDVFSPAGVEANGSLNFLKAGLVYSDALTTVSEKYAEEIRSSEEFGAGLQNVVSRRKHDLSGILNGVDYTQWDPSVDQLIPHRYDIKSLDLKVENKKALLAKMGLPFNERTPVIGIISRLADQKGLDILTKALPEIMSLGVQLVILGTGDERYHRILSKAAGRYANKMRLLLRYDDSLAKNLYAGCDMFLMPSHYEPCGLGQMMALRYGTVPIVRKTGGLSDTVADYNPNTERGTGFQFEEYSGSALIECVRRALAVYNDRTKWKRLMRNGMKQNFSWERSAKDYVKVYRKAMRKR